MSARKPPAMRQPAAWEQQIPAKLFVEIYDDRDEAVLWKHVTLPFVPRVKDALGLGLDGDFMHVHEVFWHPELGLEVWFTELEQEDAKGWIKRMKREGWREGLE